MRDDLSPNRKALIGVAALALLALASVIGLRWAFGAYAPGYELVADFGEAGQNLDDQSDVKIRGVDVGRVESIDLDDEQHARVTMRIDPDVRVPATTTASVRPISIFGPKFIDLDPGAGEDEGPWLDEGQAIEVTESPLELNDVLASANDLLEVIDPEDVTTIVRSFADGIDGLEDEIAQGVTDGRVALDGTIRSAEDRNALLASTAALADELADRGETVVGLARDANRSLPTLTERRDELAALLDGTARLSRDLADVLEANRDTLGPGVVAGQRLAGTTAGDLNGLVGFLEFVRTYSTVLDQVISLPGDGDFLLAKQQFLLASNPCRALVQLDDCNAPTIDPGPGAAG